MRGGKRLRRADALHQCLQAVGLLHVRIIEPHAARTVVQRYVGMAQTQQSATGLLCPRRPRQPLAETLVPTNAIHRKPFALFNANPGAKVVPPPGIEPG